MNELNRLLGEIYKIKGLAPRLKKMIPSEVKNSRVLYNGSKKIAQERYEELVAEGFEDSDRELQGPINEIKEYDRLLKELDKIEKILEQIPPVYDLVNIININEYKKQTAQERYEEFIAEGFEPGDKEIDKELEEMKQAEEMIEAAKKLKEILPDNFKSQRAYDSKEKATTRQTNTQTKGKTNGRTNGQQTNTQANGQQTNEQQTNGQQTNEQQTNEQQTNEQQTNGQQTNGQQTNGQQTNGQQTNTQANGQQTNGQQTNTQANGQQTNTQANGQQTNEQQTNTQANGQQANGQQTNEPTGKLDYVFVSEQEGRVYWKNVGSDVAKNIEISKAFEEKKSKYKRLGIYKMCKKELKGPLKFIRALFLKRKVNPAVIMALQAPEYKDNLQEYITKLHRGKTLTSFRLTHDLRNIGLVTRFRRHKFTRGEKKIGRVEGLFSIKNALKSIAEKRQERIESKKQKRLSEAQEQQKYAEWEPLKETSTTEKMRPMHRSDNENLDKERSSTTTKKGRPIDKFKVDNTNNKIEKEAIDKAEMKEIFKELERNLGDDVSNMMDNEDGMEK